MSSIVTELWTSGCSAGTAAIIVNPLDVIKTRLQLQSSVGGQKLGLVSTGVGIVRNEGPVALMAGLPPTLARGFIYGGMRLGLYQPIKEAITGDSGKLSFGGKILAGASSGGIAAAVSSPMELLKTRLQAKDNPHKGSLAITRHIVSTQGIAGLWKGAVPGLVRASLLTACQCATYDETKRKVMAVTGFGDHPGTHFICSMITGVVSTTACNPADVVKTIMFVSGNKYKGPIDCAVDVWKTEGPAGFMKGWTANYARLGPQTVIIFVVAENLRRLMGLGGL